MKFFTPLLVALFTLTLQAEDAAPIAALEAADDARVAAMKAVDAGQLGELLADDLRYSHSSGVVDTKASFIAALTERKLTYRDIRYEERLFTFPAPGVALMAGRAEFHLSTAQGDITPKMAFLGVWKREGEQWRFVAWQSCKLEPKP